MSVQYKIIILFLASLSLMLVIGVQIERINTQRTEALLTQKYLQDAKKIFRWLATADPKTLQNKLAALSLQPSKKRTDQEMTTVLKQVHSFGELSILRAPDGEYLLRITYMDDTLLLIDTTLKQSLKEQWLLNILVLVDIAVLLVILFIILKLLAPLKNIAKKMQDFAKGDFKSRADVNSTDEIGEVARTYNTMAQNIENLIISRQELLRDVGHELRTPISKGLFAVETLNDSPTKTIIHKSFTELERLTKELLEIEKLHAMEQLPTEAFKVESLILEALSRLMLEDESKVSLEICNNFTIEGNPDYLALALKNLIDNALKYTQEFPITIIADVKQITVKNRGEKLRGEIAHYLRPFTQEENSRQSSGFGLGLSIVKKVLDRHHLRLEYAYEGGCHLFSIRF